jgi:hypothetical protein
MGSRVAFPKHTPKNKGRLEKKARIAQRRTGSTTLRMRTFRAIGSSRNGDTPANPECAPEGNENPSKGVIFPMPMFSNPRKPYRTRRSPLALSISKQIVSLGSRKTEVVAKAALPKSQLLTARPPSVTVEDLRRSGKVPTVPILAMPNRESCVTGQKAGGDHSRRNRRLSS